MTRCELFEALSDLMTQQALGDALATLLGGKKPIYSPTTGLFSVNRHD